MRVTYELSGSLAMRCIVRCSTKASSLLIISLIMFLININEENASLVARGCLAIGGHFAPQALYRGYPEVLFVIIFTSIVLETWLFLVGLLHIIDICIGKAVGCYCWRWAFMAPSRVQLVLSSQVNRAGEEDE